MGHPRPLFRLFSSFQTNITILTTNIGMWKNVHPVYGAGIRTHNLWNTSLLPPLKFSLSFTPYVFSSFASLILKYFFYIFSLTQFAKNICKKGVNFGLPFCQFWPRLVLNGNCWFEPMQIIFFTLPNLSWRQFCSIVNSLVWTLFAVQVFF